MTRCDVFLQDPELHGEHLATCASCRRLVSWLKIAPDAEPGVTRVVSRLPVAPWEGAGHRAWGVVIAIAAIVIAAAAALFVITGVSPAEGFVAAFRSLLPRFDILSVMSAIPEMLRQAPIAFHLVVASAFVAINVVFVLLLRRPPKGYDITAR